MLSENQISEIKKQLLAQIEKSFPDDQKDFAKKKIESMNAEELEEFLKQNKLATQGQTSGQGGQCIFCSIVSGDVSSFKIAEDKEAISVLELNPVSRGHTLIIPKLHVSSKEEISKSVYSFAEKVQKQLQEKLKPKKVLQENSNMFGHEVINLIPVYEDESINSERSQAKPEELAELQKLLQIKTKPKTIRKQPKTKIQKEKMLLPKRIP